MSSPGRSRRRLWAVAGLHAALVIGWWWFARSRLLEPVVISVPDVLAGADEPLAATATVLHARTGEPQSGVPLRFFLGGTPAVGAESHAVTGASGRAAAMLERPAGAASADAGDVEVGVALASSGRWMLAGSGSSHSVLAGAAVATAATLRPGTSLALVDLGAPQHGIVALNSEAHAAIGEASRRHARIIYVLHAEERQRGELRFRLDAAGLPHGTLVLDPTPPAGAALAALRERLQALEAKVQAVLCSGAAEEAYRSAFPRASVVRLD